jgi:hypothetical protein
MLCRSLVASLLLFCACASTPSHKAISIYDKPYLSLSDSCTHDPETDTVTCKGDGFRKGLQESVEQSRALRKLKKQLDAKEAHGNIQSWFYEGQIHDLKKRVEYEQGRQWMWGVIGVAGGTVLGVGLTILVCGLVPNCSLSP